MKKIIISLAISILALTIMCVLSSIIITHLHYYKSIKTNEYVIEAIGLVLFFVSGLIFGIINKKQGFLGSIIFILLYLIFVLIINKINNDGHEKIHFLFVFGKCILYTIGSIVGVNSNILSPHIQKE